MGKILLKGGTVLTVDPDIGDRTTGDVLIEDDTIVGVEASIEADAEVVDCDRDQVREVARASLLFLFHLDAALGGDYRRVHVVDLVLAAALEGAVQRRDGQQARVVLGELAVVLEPDLSRAAFGERHRQPSEVGRERDVGPEHLEVARVLDALASLEMRDRTFGWNVEMHAKAVIAGLAIREVPVRYRKRVGKSKISGTVRGTIRAGTKIIGTILVYYPRYLTTRRSGEK